jgi:hypothetical protein
MNDKEERDVTGYYEKQVLPDQIQLRLVVDVTEDRDRAVAAIRRWFDDAWHSLGSELRDQVTADRGALLLEDSGLEAGAAIRYEVLGDVRSREFSVTDGDWAEFIESLATLPTAMFDTKRQIGGWMDEENLVPPEIDSPLTISAERFHDPNERYMILLVGARRDSLFASPESEAAALRFVHAVADIADPVYGEIGYSYGFPYTALESALRLGFDQAAKNSRDRLPGYSWITVLPEQIGAELGGVEGLVASGAFWKAERLAKGGYWIQATEHFADYQQPAAE